MWLLFHHSSGTRRVPGGETLAEHCPTCDRTTKLDEVEISEAVGMFFVDVASDKERAFKCRVCGDVFDLRDQPAAKPLPARPAKAIAPAVDERSREADRAAKANRIEDELAELKKRMGR